MKLFPLFLTIMLPFMSNAQSLTAYQLYDSKGKAVSFEDMIRSLSSSDVVFFGELHNNSIAHWMELEVTRALHKAKGGKLVLGAEMLEADNQVLLDEYFQGRIRTKDFEDEARLWKNYQTDYKPLVEFARTNKQSFIATNIPRRYASLVSRSGFAGLDSLVAEAKGWVAPLPIPYDANLPGYQKMLAMMGGHGGGDNSNLPRAQASKDATMGHFIAANLKPGHLFIHYNGSYHSDNHEGILWYVNQYKPGLTMRTITTVEQADVSKLDEENKGVADFVLVVAETMTKTY